MSVLDSFQRVVVLAPHADDGEFGCGGTIAKLAAQPTKPEIFYYAFSLCEDSIPDEFPKDILGSELEAAAKELGIPAENVTMYKYPVRHFPQYRQEILENLVSIQKEIQPDLVIMPSSYDVHQDHNTIFQEGRRAFKKNTILGYEFMWNNFSFSTSCFVALEEEHIKKKISALQQYKSQGHRFYMNQQKIMGLANYRGLQIMEDYAEAFEVIRWLIR